MVFSSLTFIFFFLPLFLLLYFVLPCKNMLLLIFSLLFYAWGEPVYILLMLFSSIVDFSIGKKIEESDNKKKFLYMSIFVNIAVLSFFKYSDFLIDNINMLLNSNISNLNLPLPIGISFFTFQTMSYSIDIYRGRVKAQRNFLTFLTYVCMFPQLIAGPIVRYSDVDKELKERTCSFDNLYLGMKIFLEGLFKKVLLANNIGYVYNLIINNPYNEISVSSMWLGIVCFSFQIYFDFSGYSDMARGIGKMLGFNYPKNFNYPYMATSISDFWRRWHMTLGSWFRDYVYIPLGGNKKNIIRNLFIVWFLTGLWHGANYNFILWGLYFGILLYIEKILLKDIISKIPIILCRISTVFLIVVSFYIFAFDDTTSLINYGKILFFISDNKLIDQNFYFYISNYFILIILCSLFSTSFGSWLDEKMKDGIFKGMIYIVLFTITVAYLVGSTYNPFLYFRF
ncbi:MAG: MBOAT family O-acyltransferase [bacterium]